MIIAVTAVGIVQVAIDEVVGVVAMRNCLMTALRAMPVAGIMPDTSMLGSAAGGITCTDLQPVLIYMIAVR